MMEDPRIQAFRTALNKWKKDTFFPKLVEEGNSKSIDRRVEEAESMYDAIVSRLHEMEEKIKSYQTGGGKDLDEIMKTLGPEDTWTESLLDNARSTAFTYLKEYPLTFNTTLIDQFKKKENFPIFQW
jgi:hypothetical protein